MVVAQCPVIDPSDRQSGLVISGKPPHYAGQDVVCAVF